MGDRNFCTAHFLTSIDHQQGFFVIREHKSLPTQEVSLLTSLGEINSGKLFSQMISINFEGKTVYGRRIVLQLNKPTRDGEKEISILTNLPSEIGEEKIAQMYQRRWNIETLFQTVTKNFNGEIKTLAYPLISSIYFLLKMLNTLKGKKENGRLVKRKMVLFWL